MSKCSTVILILLAFALPSLASAATLTLVPESDTVGVNQEFNVDVIIDAGEDEINAAQTTIIFQSDVLEVTSLNQTGSIFNFWVTEPTFSNDNGTIEFIGGTANAKTGDGLHVLAITFSARGAGSSTLEPTEAVVTASDGQGSNVLEKVVGATVSVGTQVFIPEQEFDPSTIEVAEPEVVTRVAVEATGLPISPEVRVPLYPDSEKWYKHIEEVTALWDIPPDVTKVAIAVDDLPSTEPSKAESALVTGKKLGTFDEGIAYIHVQFRNNIGWGPVTHHRIAIDQGAPLPFEITIDERESENPTPTLTFPTVDALSGISHALVTIDGGKALRSASTTLTLPAQKPGQHTAEVEVYDFAGNKATNSIDFVTIALESPIIEFINTSVSQGESLFISGRTIESGFVDILIVDKDGVEQLETTALADVDGKWNASIDVSFTTGNYFVQATVRDLRGATSFPTEAQSFRVRAKTILSIGFVELGWFEIAVMILFLALTGASLAGYYYIMEQQKMSAYQTIAIRDVKKMIALLDKDVVALAGWIEGAKLTKHARTEVEHLFGKLQDTLAKTKKYIVHQLNRMD